MGVYPRNVSESLAANISLPLEGVKLTESPDTVITPPISRGEEFELDWDKIGMGVSGTPIEYPLAVLTESGEDSDDEEETPLIPILCHRVKVQRYYTTIAQTLRSVTRFYLQIPAHGKWGRHFIMGRVS